MKTSWFKTIAGAAVAALTIGFAPKAQAYYVICDEGSFAEYGTLSVNGTIVYPGNATSVSSGATVTLTVSPNTGYSLVKVGVANASTGQAVDVTQTATGGTFTMPAYNVQVCAVFTSSSLVNTSYRYAVYNTDGVPKSGIKEWKEGEKDCIPVVGSTGNVSWGTPGTETWYVVNDSVTISGLITCYGDVHLVLANGRKLTSSSTTSSSAGIGVNSPHALTIYSQKFGTGELECGCKQTPAIGSRSATSDSGRITIHGGVVTAVCTGWGISSGAGIGSYGGGSSDYGKSTASNITINGGKVTATGANGGAGIGAGGFNSASNITINGGTVIASGAGGGAGIGGGKTMNNPGCGNATDITINGGTVTATCLTGNGAGIGGGEGSSDGGNASNIAINGGTVTATTIMGGVGATAIGGGSQGVSSNISIGQNATVYLYCNKANGVPLIGNGYNAPTAASGNSIAPGAKVFFNLVSASMPGSCEGLTIMTPATPNGGVLADGMGASWTADQTFNLVNNTLTATDKLTVNDTVGSVFGGKLIKLMYLEESQKLGLGAWDPPTVYAITIDPDITGGTVTNVPAGSAQEGRVVELTATPDEGKMLDDISVTGDNSGAKIGLTEVEVGKTYTFEMPAEAVTVAATFKAAEYAVTIDPAIQHGTVSANPPGPNVAETVVTLTAEPATGYALGAYDVYKTGVPTTKVTVTDSKFTMPAYPVTVSATFVELPPVYTNPEHYKIVNTTYQIYVNGELVPEVVPGLGVWQIASNATATVVYTCADGYQFADGSTSKTVTLGTDHNPVVPSEITPAAPVLKTEPTLTLGAVMQRYPWNNVLDIPYEMTNLMTSQKYGLTVTLVNGAVTKTVDTGITAEGVTSKSGVYSLDIGEQAPDFMNLPRTAIQVEGEVFVK